MTKIFIAFCSFGIVYYSKKILDKKEIMLDQKEEQLQATQNDLQKERDVNQERTQALDEISKKLRLTAALRILSAYQGEVITRFLLGKPVEEITVFLDRELNGFDDNKPTEKQKILARIYEEDQNFQTFFKQFNVSLKPCLDQERQRQLLKL